MVYEVYDLSITQCPRQHLPADLPRCHVLPWLLTFRIVGMVMAVGFSNLQYVDLNSSRNLFILGLSILMGLAVPNWMNNNEDQIKTRKTSFDLLC